MSKKFSSPFEGGSTANAMYNAQKKDITGNMAFSLSFVGTGVFVVILGVAKYFIIHNNMSDSSENYNAWAWLVIAAAGLVVGLIGLVNILQSMVSLGEIGSIAKKAESHASPFQNQKLNRKVTAMNQSQSLQSPGMEGMAEKSGMPLKKEKTKKVDKKESENSKLYDKYNPQQSAGAQKSAPVMEQKFDYGIEESRKLSFADEFLMKNKRDPFAQYRKDLGIQEQPVAQQQPKPQFIPSAHQVKPVNNAQTNAQANTQMLNQKEPFVQTASNAPTISLDLDMPTEFVEQNDFTYADQQFSESPQTPLNNAFVQSQAVEEADIEQNSPVEAAAPFYDPYGSHREEDDGMFFSARPTEPNTVQTAQRQVQPAPTPIQSSSSVGFKTDTTYSRQNIQAAQQQPTSAPFVTDTVSETASGMYNFSLFEEIDPLNSKKFRSSATTSARAATQNARQHTLTQPATSPVTQQTVSNPSSYAPVNTGTEDSNTLDYTNMFANETPQSHDTLNFESAFNQQTSTVEPLMSDELPDYSNARSDAQQSYSYAQTQMGDYNLGAFEEQHESRTENNVEQHTEPEPQSFSAMFLNKHKLNRSQESYADTQTDSHEICTNGTRAQRKYVEASEYDEWTCPNCGKINQEYVGTCACGRRKPRVK